MIIALVGFAAGILSGMGIGGGMILIPALTIFEGIEQHVAQTVNLFYFIPTAAAALIVHIKNKNVAIKPALKIVATGFVFSVLGAYMAVKLSSAMLTKAFAVFIIVFGIREVVSGAKEKHGTNS